MDLHGKLVCKHCGSRLIASTRVASLACLGLLLLYGTLFFLLPINSLTAEPALGLLLLTLLTFGVIWLEIQLFRALADVRLRPQPKRRPAHGHTLTPHRAHNRFKRPKH